MFSFARLSRGLDGDLVEGAATKRGLLRPFRFSSDASTLLIADPGGATGIQTPPPRQVTRQVSAPRGETIPIARPPSSPTVRQTAPTPPPIDPIPPAAAPPAISGETDRVKRGAIAAGIVGGVLMASVLAAILALRGWSGPKTGQVVVDASSAPAGATYSLDGRPVELAILGKPMAMTAGDHELVVTRDGYVPFCRSFPVAADGNTGFKVLMAKEKPPAPEPSPAPEPVAQIESDAKAADPPAPPEPVATVARK